MCIRDRNADGGEVNGWDRSYPYAGSLDPATGDWQPVEVPQAARDSWMLEARSGPLVVAGGWFVDVRDLNWVRLGRPDSGLDAGLSSIWAGTELFVMGGVDDANGYDGPSPPEAWSWTPPGS